MSEKELERRIDVLLTAIEKLELDEREVGAFYTRMRTELLEILAQGGRDTFTDEMRHAIAVAYEKMGVEPM